MTLLEALVLGIVQGLTEFLPISSTAHLKLVPVLLGWKDPGPGVSAVIQCGTLIAVLAYFRRELVRIPFAMIGDLRHGRIGSTFDSRMGWMMIVGTVPIVVCGVLFKQQIETVLRRMIVIAAAMIGLAVLLAVAEILAKRRQRAQLPQKDLAAVTWWDAILIGLAQTLALIPGSSRSGVSITAGLMLGLNRETAARFSFLLSLPAVFAAGVYKLYDERQDILQSQASALNLLAGTIVAGIVGYLSIAFLLGFLKKHTTWVFIVYRLLVGIGMLVLLALGILQN